MDRRLNIGFGNPHTVKLGFRTRRGANRIRNHGSVYLVLDVRDRVQHTKIEGPWLHLQSINDEYLLWVHKNMDPDHTVEVLD